MTAEAYEIEYVDQPRLVDRQEMARILGISITSLWRAMNEGRIPVVRVRGSLARFDPEAVIAALTEYGDDNE